MRRQYPSQCLLVPQRLPPSLRQRAIDTRKGISCGDAQRAAVPPVTRNQRLYAADTAGQPRHLLLAVQSCVAPAAHDMAHISEASRGCLFHIFLAQQPLHDRLL